MSGKQEFKVAGSQSLRDVVRLDDVCEKINNNRLMTLDLAEVRVPHGKAEFNEITELKGHSHAVLALAVLAEGTVVSGSQDNTIKLWNPKTGECLRTLRGHSSTVYALAVLAEGTVVSGSLDNTIKLWNPKTGECLRTLRGHSNWVYALAVLAEGTVVSGSLDNTIKLWNPKTGECLRTLRGHSYGVCALAVLAEGTVVSGSWDKTIKLWNPKTGECLRTLSGHSNYVCALAVLADGTVVSGSDDNTIKLWNPKTGECLRTLSGHSRSVWALAVLAEGTVVSGSYDNTIKLWSGSPLQRALSWVEIVNVLRLLKNNRSVTQLNLQQTVVDDSALGALIECCVNNTALVSLDLRKTAITEGGFRKLYDAVGLRKPALQLQHEVMSKIEAEVKAKDEVIERARKEAEAEEKEKQERFRKEAEVKKAQEEKQKKFEMLQKKAAQGDRVSQFELAQVYEKGELIPQDLKQAFEWYLKAAQENHNPAQYKVGSFYEKGLGTDKDYAQAYLWYQKSADKGNDDACLGLKSLKDKGYSPPAASLESLRAAPPASAPLSRFPLAPKPELTLPSGPAVIKLGERKSTPADAGISVSFIIPSSEITLGKELGKGAFGVVYKGSWKFNEVAVKQLISSHLSSEAIEEFKTESTIMAKLRSDYTVQFFGYTVSPQYSIVMQYMPKGSLYSLLHSKESLDWRIRYQILTDMACGLAFLHSSGVLHRDLKSLNVLLDGAYRAKLSDFGLSKVKSETRSTSSTMSRGPVGTLAWMAPELLEFEAIYAPSADVYSLGITFWEMASRKVPFASVSNPQLIPIWTSQGKREQIPADCPAKVASLIKFCWDTNPTQRPSAAEVATFLRSGETEFKSSGEAKASLDSASSPPLTPASAESYRANLASGEGYSDGYLPRKFGE